ncbi:MAG: RnfABCDGE type electron transport complex subunit B [Dokdonella sp.]
MTLTDRIDALLPQTQCTRCGYLACRPYAEAIVRGDADIDQCPPGGDDGIAALATLLGRAPKPLNPIFGEERPPLVARIVEDDCIGCTICIQACPVDAIVGAGKRMHTIIEAECTGCELCIAPCPVDCIELIATASIPLRRAEVLRRATLARSRYEARNSRLDSERSLRETKRASRIEPIATDSGSRPVVKPPAHEQQSTNSAASPISMHGSPISREAVLAAVARGKARRKNTGSESQHPSKP